MGTAKNYALAKEKVKAAQAAVDKLKTKTVSKDFKTKATAEIDAINKDLDKQLADANKAKPSAAEEITAVKAQVKTLLESINSLKTTTRDAATKAEEEAVTKLIAEVKTAVTAKNYALAKEKVKAAQA